MRSPPLVENEVLSHPPPVALAIDHPLTLEGDILRVGDVQEIYIAGVFISSARPRLVILASKESAIDLERDLLKELSSHWHHQKCVALGYLDCPVTALRRICGRDRRFHGKCVLEGSRRVFFETWQGTEVEDRVRLQEERQG